MDVTSSDRFKFIGGRRYECYLPDQASSSERMFFASARDTLLGIKVCRGFGVLMRNPETTKPSFVGILQDMWLEPDGRKMGLILWLYHPHDIHSKEWPRPLKDRERLYQTSHFDINPLNSIISPCELIFQTAEGELVHQDWTSSHDAKKFPSYHIAWHYDGSQASGARFQPLHESQLIPRKKFVSLKSRVPKPDKIHLPLPSTSPSPGRQKRVKPSPSFEIVKRRRAVRSIGVAEESPATSLTVELPPTVPALGVNGKLHSFKSHQWMTPLGASPRAQALAYSPGRLAPKRPEVTCSRVGEEYQASIPNLKKVKRKTKPRDVPVTPADLLLETKALSLTWPQAKRMGFGILFNRYGRQFSSIAFRLRMRIQDIVGLYTLTKVLHRGMLYDNDEYFVGEAAAWSIEAHRLALLTPVQSTASQAQAAPPIKLTRIRAAAAALSKLKRSGSRGSTGVPSEAGSESEGSAADIPTPSASSSPVNTLKSTRRSGRRRRPVIKLCTSCGNPAVSVAICANPACHHSMCISCHSMCRKEFRARAWGLSFSKAQSSPFWLCLNCCPSKSFQPVPTVEDDSEGEDGDEIEDEDDDEIEDEDVDTEESLTVSMSD